MKKKLTRIAFISDYLPRKCGIAVFTTDLCEAIAREDPDIFCTVVAMNDVPEGYAYPPRVSFQITQNRIDEYQSAADYLNVINVQAVCVQHEFGIYGGDAGAYLLKVLRELRVPIVMTLGGGYSRGAWAVQYASIRRTLETHGGVPPWRKAARK